MLNDGVDSSDVAFTQFSVRVDVIGLFSYFELREIDVKFLWLKFHQL